MTPAVEIYERVLADADQRDVNARLATLSAIAKDLETRQAPAPFTRRVARPAAKPLPQPLLMSQLDATNPCSALPRTLAHAAPGQSAEHRCPENA